MLPTATSILTMLRPGPLCGLGLPAAARRLLPRLLPATAGAPLQLAGGRPASWQLAAPLTSAPEPSTAAMGDSPSEPASSAAAAAAAELPSGFQVLPRGGAAPVTFLQLPTRSYGPAATLASAATDAGVLPFTHPAWVASGTYAPLGSSTPRPTLSQTVALLRQPFLPAGVSPTPLQQVLAPLSTAQGSPASAVALTSSATTSSPTTPLVDLFTWHPDTTASSQEQAGTQAAGIARLPSQYQLTAAGVPLPRALAQLGVEAAVVPCAQSAAGPGGATMNSVRAALSGGALRQSTNRLLMVAPTAFGWNPQAAADNAYMGQDATAAAGSALTRQVLSEFQGLHAALTAAGVNVELWEHPLAADTPDAVFPNNWFSTHRAGDGGGGCRGSALVLYPMKCTNRAAERRPDLLSVLLSRGYSRLVDFSSAEQSGLSFEGTGVLSLDRINGIAYVNISDRAAAPLAEAWCEALGYGELVAFRAFDAAGQPMYHTNVMMSVGNDVAIICPESITDDKERRQVLGRLTDTGHTLVTITQQQVGQLCGNVLQVLDGDGLPRLAMSSRAAAAFTPDQMAVLRRHVAGVVHAPIHTLERVGGGGVRCCMAELWDP